MPFHVSEVLILFSQVLYYNLSRIGAARQAAVQAHAAAARARLGRAPSEEGLPLMERGPRP